MYVTKNEKNSSPSHLINAVDRLFEKIVLNFSQLTIDIFKEKDKYAILKDNCLVKVNNIIQLPNKNINLIVKKYLHFHNFTIKPFNSMNVGNFLVDINKVSDQYCVSLLEIKCKCFVVKISCEQAVFISLCHDAF